MLDWTDRHCRYLHRLITRHTRLYTEMVTTGACCTAWRAICVSMPRSTRWPCSWGQRAGRSGAVRAPAVGL
jgi:hypothetical protein